MSKKRELLPIIQAIFAAILFGASAPLSKVLLGELDPIPLAGFLYLGSGLGAVIVMLFQGKRGKGQNLEAQLTRPDFPWLSGAIIAGGIIAPIFLLIGLRITPASTASLLLNFETVATAMIAGLIFKEAIDKHIFWAIALITFASILLSWSSEGWGFSPAALLILAACFFWGLDNNFTRNISSKDPLVIVSIKGLVAGSFSLILALILGNPFPPMMIILLALLLGAICYGLSIYLIILSMRHLGSTRAYALFAIAPFAGMLLSFLLMNDKPLWNFWPGIVLMIVGTWIMISENHAHDHTHEPLFHTHKHCHPDEHHDHMHQPGEFLIHGEHSHEHQHASLDHEHKHTPDLHHRHFHPG
jgi:drug/metabolite transporter (DMT)-like permease